MVKQINFGDSGELSYSENAKNSKGFELSINAIFILVQTVCSCLAGVYNEYLLKNKGSDINIYVQNVFMYIDSILCNVILLSGQGNLMSAFAFSNLTEVFRFNVLIIMVNNCAIGIVTSFFLKYMNSILKTFASALELLFTAILCYFLFSIPVYVNTLLAILIVSFSVYLYSQSPVNNSKSFVVTTEDKKSLLSETDDEDLQMDHVLVK